MGDRTVCVECNMVCSGCLTGVDHHDCPDCDCESVETRHCQHEWKGIGEGRWCAVCGRLDTPEWAGDPAIVKERAADEQPRKCLSTLTDPAGRLYTCDAIIFVKDHGKHSPDSLPLGQDTREYDYPHRDGEFYWWGRPSGADESFYPHTWTRDNLWLTAMGRVVKPGPGEHASRKGNDIIILKAEELQQGVRFEEFEQRLKNARKRWLKKWKKWDPHGNHGNR